MGDRFTWYENCPKCGGNKTVEVYDAPSCYMFSRICEKCNWTDGKNYYEVEPNTIQLLTKEEAKKKGLEWIDGLSAALSRDKEI